MEKVCEMKWDNSIDSIDLLVSGYFYKEGYIAVRTNTGKYFKV